LEYILERREVLNRYAMLFSCFRIEKSMTIDFRRALSGNSSRYSSVASLRFLIASSSEYP